MTTSLLTFPCEFTIKIFGAASDDFEATVLMIINQVLPDMTKESIQSRASKQGQYLALTVTLPVNSQAQLDLIYQKLSASPDILMVL
jgi:putative lipoic acid-binding regulatory protein